MHSKYLIKIRMSSGTPVHPDQRNRDTAVPQVGQPALAARLLLLATARRSHRDAPPAQGEWLIVNHRRLGNEWEQPIRRIDSLSTRSINGPLA